MTETKSCGAAVRPSPRPMIRSSCPPCRSVHSIMADKIMGRDGDENTPPCPTSSSPNGATNTSPGHRPGWSRRDTKALKGRPNLPASPPMSRPFRAEFHLLPQPRASLRFALGWYEAAPLGLNTTPEATSAASRPPERFGFTIRCRPFSLSQRERVGVRENGPALTTACKQTESLLALPAAVPFTTDARLQFLIN